jgi:DNA polymerase-3 subunit epsilon
VRWWRTFLGVAEPIETRLERIAAQRWVVLDVETGGLDAQRDPLLAIGAVAVRDGRIDIDDSFETVVRPTAPSDRANVLIHGIGQGAQQEGVEPAVACSGFLEWAGDAPFVAFHAAFDRGFLSRAVRDALGSKLEARWLDLAALAPALNPGLQAKALDDWLVHFGLQVEQRHNASADAFVTAMLFLRLLAQVPAVDRDVGSLQRLAQAQRWAGG